MEKLIKEANILVDRSINDQDFLEEEIRDIFAKILDFSNETIYSYSEQIKDLFKRIICMDKSTGSFVFYHLLIKRNLSFSEELLIFGIKNEPYYNNNDFVFIHYLKVASLKNGIETLIDYFLEKTEIFKCHYSQYNKIFKNSYELRNSITVPEIPFDIEKEILDILENNNFYQTVFKAISVVIFFDIKSAIPFILDKFQNSKKEELKDQNQCIFNLRGLSLSLYYLTNNFYYKEFYDYSVSKDISYYSDKDEIRVFAVSLLNKIQAIEKP